MLEEPSQSWFLEVDGKKTGPFSLDQVLGLLADKEIPERQRVTSESIGGAWITALELSARHAKTQQPSPAARTFAPPPRPPEPIAPPPATIDLQEPPALEATTELFDTLQAAKERKTHHPPRGAHAGAPSAADESKPSPSRKTWMIAGISIILLAAAWGLASYIKQRPPSAEAQRAASETPPEDSESESFAQPGGRTDDTPYAAKASGDYAPPPPVPGRLPAPSSFSAENAGPPPGTEWQQHMAPPDDQVMHDDYVPPPMPPSVQTMPNAGSPEDFDRMGGSPDGQEASPTQLIQPPPAPLE